MKAKSNIIRLGISNLEEIMEVERRAFIPSIQTTKKNILDRLSKKHVYLGIEIGKELIGTLALRFAHFVPNFMDFCRRNPTFSEYAENYNESNANAVFIYSIGIVPQNRNGINARNLLQGAFDVAKQKGMEFLVGDARVPSYNGSSQNPQYEHFDKNGGLHNAIEEYFKTGILPPRKLIEQDPVAGFYLKAFPDGDILGITDKNFWEGDEPCGGHMTILYHEVGK